MYKYVSTLLVFLIVTAGAFAQDDLFTFESNIIAKIISSNPQIAVSEARVLPLEHLIQPESSLPDPVVSLGLMNFPVATSFLDMDRTPMTQLSFSVQQKFPAPGVRSAKSDVAMMRVLETGSSVKEDHLIIAHHVRQSLRQIAATDDSLHLLNELNKNYAVIKNIAVNQYETGKISLDGVLKIQLAIDTLNQRYIKLEQARQLAVNTIQALAGYTQKFDIEQTSLASFIEAHANQLSSISIEDAVATHPRILALSSSMRRNLAEVKLKESLLRPGFGISASYGYRYDDVDFWSVGFSTEIPWQRNTKQRELLESKRSESNLINAQILASKNKIISDYEAGLISLDSISKQIELYEKDLIPQAELISESQLHAFETNSAKLTALLETENRLLTLKANLIDLKFQYVRNAMELETALGIYPQYRGDDND